MKSKFAAIAPLSAVLAFCLALFVADSSASQRGGDRAGVGRYQATAGTDGLIYMINTETGECWRSLTNDQGRWHRVIDPIPTP